MLPEWARMLVPVFLAGQGLLVYWSAGTEHPPAPPARAQFPSAFSGWMELHQDPIDADVVNTLRADRLVSRTYTNGAAEPVGFLVAWFQSQRAGTSQPHSPKVCLPASGWTPAATGYWTIPAARSITVNRYVVANPSTRAVVLYWYQTSRRAIAGEWAAKLWLVADALRDQRADTALVRIVVEDQAGGDEHATEIAADFARAVYPLLSERLPR